MHTLRINNETFYNYSLNDCIASIRAAWAWGYFESASIDNEQVNQEFLEKIGCL